MNTLDKWKTKIKQVNIKQFNPMNKDTGQVNTDPDSQQSTDMNTVQSIVSNKPVQQPLSTQAQSVDQQKQPAQSAPQQVQKTTVTFSINTMHEFSHEELQQVIKKYDGEYKKMKTQLKEQTQQITELEERAGRAEKQSSELTDQALCYQENGERMKDHVQKLMQENEHVSSQHQWISKEKEELEQEHIKLKQDYEKFKVETQAKHEKECEDLREKLSQLESKYNMQQEVQLAEGDSDKIDTIHKQQLQEYELKIKSLHDKISKQDSEMLAVQAAIAKLSADKELMSQDLMQAVQEKSKIQHQIEQMLLQHKEEMTRKTELIGKKEKLNEQYQKKVSEVLDQKQECMDKIEELEGKLKSTKDKISELNSENNKYNNEYSDKFRSKDVQLEKLNEELKHARSTARSQETTISYFRKKIEEMQKQLEQEKSEKLNLQSEMRRMDHLSSKHNSPRNTANHESEEDFRSFTQKLINAQDAESTPKHEQLNSSGATPQLKLQDLKIEYQDRRQQSQRSSSKSKSQSQTQLPANKDLQEDLQKLREEYDHMAGLYHELKKEKLALEEQISEEAAKSKKRNKQLAEWEEKVATQEKTIEELERRREQAKKEIKLLNYKLEKQKLQVSSTTSNTNITNQSMEESKQSIKDQNPIVSKQARTVATEEQSTPSGYTGIDKLKRIKREMEGFYKDLIKILFMDQVDKQLAIAMEKKVNNLIMSINDQIDEIEIRQIKESQALMNDIKVQQPQLELQKRAVRANSSDVRSQPQRPQQQQQQPAKSMMGNLMGNIMGQYNPYSGQQKNAVVTQMKGNIVGGLPPQSPSQKSGFPVKAIHKP